MTIDPWLTAALLPGKVLELVGTPTAMARLGNIVSGDLLIALAALEADAHYDVAQISTRIAVAGGKHTVTGRKSLVFSGPCAQRFLVTARSDNGIPVLLDIPADAEGVTVTGYRVLDGSRAAEVTFDNVDVPDDAILLSGSEVLSLVGRAMDVASAAICADMFGAMSEAFRKTLEYARTRKQFGVAIGSLQVIQHYLVDMFIEVQQSESLVWMAGIRGDTDDTIVREQAISTAKAYLCRSAVAVTQKAIQIHGGIGVTEELDIGHYFRRVTHYSALFGDREYHVRRLAKNQNVEALNPA
jgi:alkylation response protein AidB-like acyl-CoA dehydrogenase